jgi:hypothetical protein
MAATALAEVALCDNGGRWLSVAGGGEVVALSGVLDEGGLLFLELLDAAARTYRIRTATGGRVAVVGDAGLLVVEDAGAAAPSTSRHVFAIQPSDASPGAHVLQAAGSGLYVCVDGGGCVSASAAAPDFFCAFRACFRPLPGMVPLTWALLRLDGRKVALATLAHTWVTAAGPSLLGGGEVTARATKLLVWEQFTLAVLDKAARTVALRSTHDRWVCPRPDGDVRATAREVGGWERLTLEDAGDGLVALRTPHPGGPYLSAHGPEVDARARGVSDSERFYVLELDAATKRYWNVPLPDVLAAARRPVASAVVSGGGAAVPAALPAGGADDGLHKPAPQVASSSSAARVAAASTADC